MDQNIGNNFKIKITPNKAIESSECKIYIKNLYLNFVKKIIISGSVSINEILDCNIKALNNDVFFGSKTTSPTKYINPVMVISPIISSPMRQEGQKKPKAKKKKGLLNARMVNLEEEILSIKTQNKIIICQNDNIIKQNADISEMLQHIMAHNIKEKPIQEKLDLDFIEPKWPLKEVDDFIKLNRMLLSKEYFSQLVCPYF